MVISKVCHCLFVGQVMFSHHSSRENLSKVTSLKNTIVLDFKGMRCKPWSSSWDPQLGIIRIRNWGKWTRSGKNVENCVEWKSEELQSGAGRENENGKAEDDTSSDHFSPCGWCEEGQAELLRFQSAIPMWQIIFLSCLSLCGNLLFHFHFSIEQ